MVTMTRPYRLLKRIPKTYPDSKLIASPRWLWYNNVLDPDRHLPPDDPDVRTALLERDYPSGEMGEITFDRGGELVVPTVKRPANLVSSLCEDGLHRPALDIDIPFCEFGDFADQLGELGYFIASESAGGNTHVYAPDVGHDWATYRGLLRMLADADWLEGPYVSHCVDRGQSLLRLPGIPKMWFNEQREPVPTRRPSLSVYDMVPERF